MADMGHWKVEGVLSGAECNALTAELATPATGRRRAGARHLMKRPAVAGLARDERLMAIARAAVGEQAVPYRATLFEKSGQSNWLVVWHQDTALPQEEPFESPGWGPWSTKCGIHYAHAPTWALERIIALRVHLDESRADNGPLRVIPGSHRLGVLSDEEVFRIAHENPAEDCQVQRGGVLAMRPLLIHSSPKAESPARRCVLHLEYAKSLVLAEGMRLAVA